MWWSLSSSVFAKSTRVFIPVNSTYSKVFSLPTLRVSGNNSYYQNNSAAGAAPIPYWENNTVFYSFDIPVLIDYRMYPDDGYFIDVPQDCDRMNFYAFVRVSPISGSDGYGSFSVVGVQSFSSVSSGGFSSYVNGGYIVSVDMDVTPGQRISFDFFGLNMSVLMSLQSGSNISRSYSPTFNYSLGSTVVTFYNSDLVTSDDLSSQTEDLTNGFDNSSGSQDADRLGSQVDEYLKTEDQLFGEMQYDVPEVDLQSDSQGILLASNFMQSLYVSDSFISRVVTFTLTFGLVLYIVGWLKKRGSG